MDINVVLSHQLSHQTWDFRDLIIKHSEHIRDL